MNFMVILETLADFSNFLCGKISVSPSKNGKMITRSIGWGAFVYTVLKMAGINIINALIYLLRNCWGGICAFILLIAILPPIIAFFEKNDPEGPVRKDYIWKNFFLNIAGSLSAISMIYVAYEEIQDFWFIEDFYVESIIAILVPICVWIVFSYQSIEQQKYSSHSEAMNHDPSLKWKNQMFNVLHLINVCFWSLMLSVLVVAYTLYCHIHNIQLDLEWSYLWLLTVVLIFFYCCAFIEHDYVRLVFLVDVPLILICGMYWMSWFEKDDRMMIPQFMFFLVHSLAYTLLIYRKEKVIAICKAGDEKDAEYKLSYKIFSFEIKIKNVFSIISFIIIIITYVIFMIVPYFLVERDSFILVDNSITKICRDTDKDSEAVLDEIKTLEWYDAENDDVDRARFLRYIYDNLFQEMVDKDAISETDRNISHEELVEWYINTK